MAETKNKYGADRLNKQYHKIILDRIIHCTYKSNDIITIHSLITEFNVSKTPIREALLELCEEGLLKSIPKFGYEVVPFQESQVLQVFNFRYLIETSAMDVNWDMLTKKKNIDTLNALIDASESLREEANPLERWEHTAKFHLTLATFYQNEYLSNQLQKVIRFLGIAYARSSWSPLNPINHHLGEECHRDIVRGIEENNKGKALEALKSDMRNYGKISFGKP
ncbi:GntR family transcriptional regulator [uncultured Sphaerochaeta sp.]|uniref:GntR family transcriptional regulator n=1 Tax=uncultured Sphaerochaeta sp. TaxID=886478 RepID=UPI002A0A6931|nr:GntR family transcriptional regulator [uncultured Sphaerochaeta sp.]